MHRRLLNDETGTVHKDWGGKIPVALVFPNTYHAGMSNLGFQSLYGLLNDYGDVVCERFFLPEKTQMEEYARTGTPLLSVESQKPLGEFEIVAFSLSIENDYLGVLQILDMARLPRRAAERNGAPLVIAGGVTMRTNPEPVADFFDVILIGDGEILIPPFLEAWKEVRSSPLPNNRLLHLAGAVPGAYVPALYEAVLNREGRLQTFQPIAGGVPETIKTVRAEQLPSPALASRILTPNTEFADTRLIEIGRGCYHGCRFCLAGFVYRPPRTASVQAVLDAAGEPVEGKNRIGLISPAVADHPRLEEIVRALTDQGREVAVSSLRVEALTPGLLDALVVGKLKSAAVAPEAGTERLRAFINKGLTERQILSGVDILADAGVRRLKLYFMIGLPSETEEDVEAIAALSMKIKNRLKASFKGSKKLPPEITLTMSSFVPKPSTPFETQPMLDKKSLNHRAKIVQNILRREKGIRAFFDPPRWSWLQTLLSRGDRRTGRLLEAVVDAGGSLPQALKKIDLDPESFVTRSMRDDDPLPWSFIDHGLKAEFLDNELKRAQAGKHTPPCNPEKCRLCGVCPAEAPHPAPGG